MKRRPARLCPAHPCLCGEHPLPLYVRLRRVGSTPTMGNTSSGMWVPTCNAAQPRLCGEDRSYENASLFKEGSPPHMRGILYDTTPRQCEIRLTPAHAGNTCRRRAGIGCRRVHPHTCGEHTAVRLHSLQRGGSPPHMRGTQRRNRP